MRGTWKRKAVTAVVASLGASSGLVVGMAGSAVAAPLPNGGFESPEVHPPPFVTFTAPASVGAWEVRSGSVDLVAEGEGGWQDAQGAAGDQSLDLNGTVPGTICQSVPTAPDSAYLMSFALSHNGGVRNTQGIVEVYVDGSLVDQRLHDGASVQDAGEASYEHHEVSVFSEGSTTEICLASQPGGSLDPRTGPVVDDVRLNALPSATITTPPHLATYFQGQDVSYDFECTDPDGAEDIVSCEATDSGEDDPVLDGQAIDTSTTGVRTLSLVATDAAGSQDFDSATYSVVPVTSLCRGTGAILLNAALGQANPPISPCVGGTKSLVRVSSVLGFPMPSFLSFLNSTIVATAVTGSTASAPGAYAADGSVAAVKINIPSLGLNLDLIGIHSSARAELLDGCEAPTLSGVSGVATLQINGKNTALVQGPSFIPLPGLGGIWINQQVVVGTTLIQRAFSLDLPGTALDIVLGESIAGASCDTVAVPLPLDSQD